MTSTAPSDTQQQPPAALLLHRCCRHAFGDQYRATDMVVEGPGKLEMTFTPADGGKPQQFTIYDFKGGWVGGWGVGWGGVGGGVRAWAGLIVLVGGGPGLMFGAGMGWGRGGLYRPHASPSASPTCTSPPPLTDPLCCHAPALPVPQVRAWPWGCTTPRSRSAALQSRASSTPWRASGEPV